MTRKLMTSKISHHLGARALIVSLAALSLVGCVSTRIVGENEPEEGPSQVVNQTGDGTNCQSPTAADPSCSDYDAMVSADHDAWACSPNQLGALTGTEWVLVSGSWKDVSAYIGSALRLRFGVDGTSTFEVGTPVPPVAEIGHLCGERTPDRNYCELGYQQEFLVGGVYPLHGITQEEGGWTLPFREASYLEEWCGLQPPRREQQCQFSILGNNGFDFGSACTEGGDCSGNVCSLGHTDEDGVYHVVEERDCGWVMLAGKLGGTCTCTSSRCFSAPNPSETEWHAALSEDGQVLTLTAGDDVQEFGLVP